jgi:hypothetical protein
MRRVTRDLLRVLQTQGSDAFDRIASSSWRNLRVSAAALHMGWVAWSETRGFQLTEFGELGMLVSIPTAIRRFRRVARLRNELPF